MTRPPTIIDVAAKAGVSRSLVSLVLQNSSRVSEKSRSAVLEAMSSLGYVPNSAARNLAAHTTRTVGVVFSTLRNPWHADVLEGLETSLRVQGMQTLLGDANRDADRLDAVLTGFQQARVDAIVLVGQVPVSDLIGRLAQRLPVIVVGTRDVSVDLVDVIANDDVAGARLVAEHLLGRGHTRIGHITGSNVVSALRRQGFVDALAERGLAPTAIETCDLSEDGGYRAAIRLMTGATRPTAIFAATDIVGVGVLSAAHELGLRVPEDVAVVGYDNTSLARTRHIGLTSVDIRSAEIGHRVASRISERLSGSVSGHTQLELLRPELIARRSTAQSVVD